jgi:hypothetical protein
MTAKTFEFPILRALALAAATLVVAPLILASAAKSESADAVTDAQAMLDKMIIRADAGGVGVADVAIARYNLLEMKLKAGQMSLDAFCRSAQVELTTVAKNLDDDPSGQKSRLQEAIAGMPGSEAKCREAMAATAGLLFGATDAAVSAEALRQAEAAFAEMLARRTFGTATTFDVAQAQLAVLQTRYRAGQISRAAFCQGAVFQAPNAIAQAQSLVKAVIDREAVGDASLIDEIAARRKLYEIKALCAG